MRWDTSIVLVLLSACISQGSLIEEVEELLKSGDQLDLGNATDLILLIGTTGVGKSTLAKFITKDPSLQVIEDGGTYNFVDNGTISNVTTVSMTLLPNVYHDNATGQTIVDCPGFSDTREPKHEIASSYFVKQLLENAKRVKIILVENHFSLQRGKDRLGLTRLLKHVSELIPNIKHFQGAFGLVPNKVEKGETTDVQKRAAIMTFLKESASELSKKDESDSRKDEGSYVKPTKEIQKTLETIIGEGTGENIALFRTPNMEGSPWDSSVLKKCYVDIRSMIFDRLPWVDNEDQVYRFTLTTDSVLFIKEHLVPHNNEIALVEVSKIMSTFLAEVGAKFSASLTIAKKVQLVVSIKENFSRLLVALVTIEDLAALNANLSKITPLSNIDSKRMQQLVFRAKFFNEAGVVKLDVFLNEVKQLLVKTEEKLDEILQFYQFLEILEVKLESYETQSTRLLMTTKKIQKSDFESFIFNSSKFHIHFENKNEILAITLEDFLLDDLNMVLETGVHYKSTSSYNNETNQMHIEARNLLASEIVAQLGENPEIATLTFNATNKMFIDKNLAVSKTNAIYIEAPFIEVIGDQKIILKADSLPSSDVTISPAVHFSYDYFHGRPYIS